MNASSSHHPQSNQKLSLAERAAALKESVARMVRPRFAHQPSPETLPSGPAVEGDGGDFLALDRGPHDLSRGYPSASNRNPAAMGDRPRQETDMGRHETFESAEPHLDAAVTALLTEAATPSLATSPSLPEPGSAEAMALFSAACSETDRLNRDAVHGYPMLKRNGSEWWCKESLGRALEAGEITPVEYARLYPLAAEREHRIDAAAISTNIAALHALAFASDYERIAFQNAGGASVSTAVPPGLPTLERRFDAAHSAWLDAVNAVRLPRARYHRHLRMAARRGNQTLADAAAAEALPGVKEALFAEEDTYIAVSNIALEIHARPVRSLDDLALAARATSVLVWPNGRYDADAALGTHEDVDKGATRALIKSCLRYAEQNTSSREDTNELLEDAALRAAIIRHRVADAAFIAAAVAADPILIRNEGGDTSVYTMAPLEDAEDAADLEMAQSWRALFRIRPNTLTGLLRLLEHTAEHYEDLQGIDDPPDVFGALIGAVEALRFATQPRPAEHDLSLLSISELEHLAQIVWRERQALLAVESQGFCWSKNKESFTALGMIIQAEGERMAFLGDDAVREIKRRRPTEKSEANLRLEALVRHDLNCNGYIEPELMTEVVKAWSAR